MCFISERNFCRECGSHLTDVVISMHNGRKNRESPIPAGK